MKTIKQQMILSFKALLIFTLLCGGIYTGFVTVFAQTFFPYQANGSILEINGKKYGSELLGQTYSDESHMWGRIMILDIVTYQDENGESLMYAVPSNLSPTSEEYSLLISKRVEILKKYHPDMNKNDIPVDLVTVSGSGLDPHISVAAANYQISRIAKANGIEEAEVKEIIESCTTKRFLGIFGEETVHVLKVNLMLDGIFIE